MLALAALAFIIVGAVAPPPPPSPCMSWEYSSPQGCKRITPCRNKEYIYTAHTANSDAVCKYYTRCCASEYESKWPTRNSDRECKPLTVCNIDQHEDTAPQNDGTALNPRYTTDRVCAFNDALVDGTNKFQNTPTGQLIVSNLNQFSLGFAISNDFTPATVAFYVSKAPSGVDWASLSVTLYPADNNGDDLFTVSGPAIAWFDTDLFFADDGSYAEALFDVSSWPTLTAQASYIVVFAPVSGSSFAIGTDATPADYDPTVLIGSDAQWWDGTKWIQQFKVDTNVFVRVTGSLIK